MNYGRYRSSSSNSSLHNDMHAVIISLLGKGILSTGATVKTIKGGTFYIPDTKQWIAVNKPDAPFDKIKTTEEMKTYLSDIQKSLEGRKYLYKYTNLVTVQSTPNSTLSALPQKTETMASKEEAP